MAGQLHRFAANSYCGGYNTCSIPGVFEGFQTYDFDLENAYPTAMCLIFDIDWDNPIEREFKNEDLSLQAFHTPMDPMFCLIDFEFPESVKYPCIAIHNRGSIIFPRKAEAVYASGPSMFLALRLGAKVHVRYGYVARILFKGLEPSMSLRVACRQMVSDRAIARETYGKGSIEEKLLKLFVNGGYGKIAQNVIEKHTWDCWREEMEDIGCSSITSPERAALITDIVRCMLIGTMNQLSERGLRTFSVTTDGFITEASLDDVNACNCYGFRKYFEDSRLWLTGSDPTIWAEKHDQFTLINPTTRCNVGFGGRKGVLAHGGFVTGEIKDTKEDAARMAETILTRTGRVTYTTLEFVNQKEMVTAGCDFYTFRQKRSIRLDFDFKRRPIRESFHPVSGVIEGIEYEYVNLVFLDKKLFGTYERQIALRKILKEAFKRMQLDTGRDLVAIYIAYHFLKEQLLNLKGYTDFLQDIEGLMPEALPKIKADETNRSQRYKSYAESLALECEKWFIDNGCLPDKTMWKSLDYKYHVDDERRKRIQGLVTSILQGMKDITK